MDMKKPSNQFLHQVLKISMALSGLCFLIPFVANAQIVPGNTLPNNSVIERNGNLIEIKGGTTAGKNLFHSFEQFSVLGGNTAYFNNAVNIQNIFTRVTGNNLSVIDGILKANGTANLFLLNPNGIIFGKGAQIDIGGSFLATTADRIVFADGTSFSATELSNTPILTVSAPVGLGFGREPEAIQVRGIGHKLEGFSTFTPFIREGSPTGLSVPSQKTIALVGGDVTFDGGILTAEGGRIEIGSVESGLVGLNFNEQGLTLNYQGITDFKNIQLSQQSLLDASGGSSGSIQIQGSNVSFTDGSIALLQNQENTSSGSIIINADSLSLNGLTFEDKIPSLVRSETLGKGKGADINISTSRLQLADGSRIESRTDGAGKGGTLYVTASDFISIRGFSVPDRPSSTSRINATTINAGKSGNIFVSTPQITIGEGGIISSSSIGTGMAGNVTVNATEISLFGKSPLGAPSSISGTAFTSGSAGNLTINTSNLSIKNGAEVTSSAIGSASAGNVSVNARRINISGESGISSAVVDAGELEQEFFGSSPITSGNSGTIAINTEKLNVSDTSRVSVINEGTGLGGAIEINANAIDLKNDGGIVASADSGEGGNIFINSNDIRLRSSEVTATAGGTGNGGDVRINTGTFVALDESQITARAVEGRGGNIFINARGVFIDLPVEEVFSADSELGIDGTVTINTPDINISKEFNQSPPQTISAEELVARSCVTNTVAQRGNFVNAGNTGLPPNPETAIDEFNTQAAANENTQSSNVEIGDRDQKNSSTTSTTFISSVAPWQPRTGIPIVRATELVRTKDGRLLFVAEASPGKVEGVEYLTCH
jgi:filamentous hemagglutinin family protein